MLSNKTRTTFLLLLLLFFLLSLSAESSQAQAQSQQTDDDNNSIGIEPIVDDSQKELVKERIITAVLTRSEVSPPPEFLTSPEATATATFVYGQSSNTIIFAINIENPSNIQLLSANLHCGSSITPSNIIVNLSPTDLLLGSNSEIGVVGVITQTSLLQNQCTTTVANLWTFMKTSGSTYIQITSNDNLQGEIRANLPAGNVDLTPVSTAIGHLSEDLMQNPPITSTAKGNIIFIYGGPPSDSIVFSMEIQNPDKLGIFGGNNGASLHCASITPTNIIANLVLPLSNDQTSIGNVDLINTNDLIENQCVTTTINLWNFLKSQGSTTYVTIDTTKNPENGELRGNVESPKNNPTPTAAPSSNPDNMPSVMSSIEPTSSMNDTNNTDTPTMSPQEEESPTTTDPPTSSSSSSSQPLLAGVTRYCTIAVNIVVAIKTILL